MLDNYSENNCHNPDFAFEVFKENDGLNLVNDLKPIFL